MRRAVFSRAPGLGAGKPGDIEGECQADLDALLSRLNGENAQVETGGLNGSRKRAGLWAMLYNGRAI